MLGDCISSFCTVLLSLLPLALLLFISALSFVGPRHAELADANKPMTEIVTPERSSKQIQRPPLFRRYHSFSCIDRRDQTAQQPARLAQVNQWKAAKERRELEAKAMVQRKPSLTGEEVKELADAFLARAWQRIRAQRQESYKNLLENLKL